MSDYKKWYWIACNGPSCAACPGPLAWGFTIDPVPEQLIGFETQQEQQIVQEFLRTAPLKKLKRYMESLVKRIKRGEVAYCRPEWPDPPPTGPTYWLEGDWDSPEGDHH